jgi:hypothetical protein
MIVGFSRANSDYFRVFPHHPGTEAYWLSPAGLEYIRSLGFRPYEQALVPEASLARLRILGHLRPMRDAPPLGAWAEVPLDIVVPVELEPDMLRVAAVCPVGGVAQGAA